MGKLHEILAVESDLEGHYKRIVGETTHVFQKGEHFSGAHKTLVMFDDARQREAEAAEVHQEMVTTVPKKLNYTQEAIIKYLDVVLQKESANQQAKADIVIDDKVVVSNVPATFLLGLENKLKYIRAMYEAIPTLPPQIEWKKDETMGNDVYVTVNEEKANKTEKIIKHQVLVQPTKEHPAQIEKWTQDTPVGIFSVRRWSGMLSPREKMELLTRIDVLLRATKEARQRANCQEVENRKIGEKLFQFINTGTV